MSRTKKQVDLAPVVSPELKALEQRVKAIELKLELQDLNLKAPEVKQTNTVTTESKVEITSSSQPVPLEYREIVDSILNKSFGLRVQALSDAPAFNYTIVVPEKYSPISPSYREMYKEDVRPKVISYAEGLNGVRDWTERVFNNFNSDVRALIVSDRSQMK